MVFVRSRLTGGDPLFTLSQVAVNDSIMVLAFAPLVIALLAVPILVNHSKGWYERGARVG